MLPPFQPNEHLFEKYAEKGKERWQVYAWCLRDVMAEAGGFKVTEVPNRAKLAY